jgi:hypothetical protein
VMPLLGLRVEGGDIIEAVFGAQVRAQISKRTFCLPK